MIHQIIMFPFLRMSCNSPALDPQGFLAKDLQVEALGKLDHRVKAAAEQLMKILEQIDALVIHFPTECYWKEQ